ncbi:MAG TPA: AAA family ATPase [Blastocatellia bacterium]|nr:AAA family ATPase [Blastocatellia bacterium]
METITIPRNTLVVLCGAAGCGKSTFAARHFLPTQIVSSDDCRARISDDPTNQGVSHHAFDLMYYTIRKRLLLRRLTVADATHLERGGRKAVVNIARQFGFKTAVIMFDIPLETCVGRNAARARIVPEDALRAQYDMLQAAMKTIPKEGFDYVFVLNAESQDQVVVKVGPPARRGRES